MSEEEGTGATPPAPEEAAATSTPEPAKAEADSPAPAKDDGLISFDDFMKVELRVGQVKQAEKIEKSRKLIKLQVDIGGELRQVVAGIAEKYEAEDLVGRRIIVVANLAPVKLMGVESRGMLLAASIDGVPILAGFDEEVEPGTVVR